MAQELLITFADELGGVTLKPSEVAGHYSISMNEEVIFDRKQAGGFTDVKEIKQLLRDKIAPGKSLGHSDKQQT